MAQRIDAITTARFGTGGPACAREHHRSMAATAWEVHGGAGRWVRGGTGRMLVWFPEPAGPQDCYRAGLAEPMLLERLFPACPRIQALQAATRRDRLTARLPMLRRPHAEGLVGAAWVEVRGRRLDGVVDHRVMSATAPQATGAAAIAAAVTDRLLTVADPADRLGPLGWAGSATDVLRSLPDDVHLWTYDGASVVASGPNAPLQAARKWRSGRESGGNRPIERRTSK